MMTANMTDYEAYKMYLALRAHFQTDEYDVIKQRGRIRASQKSYAGSGKSFGFRRLTKIYKDAEICDFMVANFTAGDMWGGVFDVDAGRQYQEWKRRVESLRYVFSNDLDQLISMAADEGTDLLTAEAGRHPLILRAYLGHKICLETLVILDVLLNFREALDQQLQGLMMWPETSRLIRKYRPFLKFDLEVFKKIHAEKFNH
jgi:hypothetical protein